MDDLRVYFEVYWENLKGKYHPAYKESVFENFKDFQKSMESFPDPKEVQQDIKSTRDSLAQEIWETLKTRGFWVPHFEKKASSELINAIGMALDSIKKHKDVKELVEAAKDLAESICLSGDMPPSKNDRELADKVRTLLWNFEE